MANARIRQFEPPLRDCSTEVLHCPIFAADASLAADHAGWHDWRYAVHFCRSEPGVLPSAPSLRSLGLARPPSYGYELVVVT